MQKVCFVCLQPSRLKCSRCDAVHYCGKECQKKDWKVHKHNCRDNNINDEVQNNVILLNQAKNYTLQGSHDCAEKILRKLLEPSVRSQHSDKFLAGSFISLSIALNNQGKYSEAVKIALESLDLCRLKLGADHLFTRQSMNTLASSYIKLRNFNQAYELLNECIEKSKIINGIDHEETIRLTVSLGDAYSEDGRQDKAQKLFRECLQMITKNGDIQSVDIKFKLAISCIQTSHYEESESLLKECLEISHGIEGANHPRSFAIMMNLALVCEKQNKPLDQIEVIRKKCLAKSIVIYGKDHHLTLKAMNNLAVCYRDQGKLDQAEKMFKECLERRTSILGKDHPDTVAARKGLDAIYCSQGRYDEALKLNQGC